MPTHSRRIPGARTIWEQYHGLSPTVIGRFLETTTFTYEDEFGFYCHAGVAPGMRRRRQVRRFICGAQDIFLLRPSSTPRPLYLAIMS